MLGKRGRDRAPRRHITGLCARVREQPYQRNLSMPRDELWEIYERSVGNGNTKNIELDKNRAYLPFEQARG
jgi:hypothetical protein